MAKSTTKKLAVLKTKENNASVDDFLQAIGDEAKRKDAADILSMMIKATGEKPKMWGTSIIGFGNYIYESPTTGRSGEWFMMGFSPRKQNITLYLMPGVGHYKELVEQLGKCKTGGSCLYINKLSDVNTKVLKQLLSTAYKNMKQKNKT
ncbi:MAG: DUF1801 domain-containing protein [Lacibacter sp.]|jgi:hypothetical protein